MMWTELSQASIDEVLKWATNESWSKSMAACQQDALWHPEGDVWTHTKMVCSQLPQLDEWAALHRHEQTVLLFTALFHDSGKPQTSNVDAESGRIRSPKHALKGERVARNVLRDLGCDLVTREQIAALVRLHSRPAFLLDKPDPNREVVWQSWLTNNRLLYLFALADTRGRKAGETARPEENLHLWKLVAEENGCFDRPYGFANDQARFVFYRQTDPDLHYVPHEEYRCTVTMMSGLPGSGKDTWLMKNRQAAPVVALDDLRMELGIEATANQGKVAQLAKDRCRELLRARRSFAFNATNTVRQTRQRWIGLFAEYGARIEIVYVEPPMSVIFDQNKRRSEPVPENVIRELSDICEPPTWAECHDLILVEH